MNWLNMLQASGLGSGEETLAFRKACKYSSHSVTVGITNLISPLVTFGCSYPRSAETELKAQHQQRESNVRHLLILAWLCAGSSLLCMSCSPSGSTWALSVWGKLPNVQWLLLLLTALVHPASVVAAAARFPMAPRL